MAAGSEGEDNVVMVLLIKDLSFNTSIEQYSIDKEFKPRVASQQYYPLQQSSINKTLLE